MNKKEIKALLPDDVEYMIIGKDDYDRLCGQLTYENIKYKEVLIKIKEYCNNRLQYYNEMKRDYDTFEFECYAENDNENILELLEEIE